MRFLAILPIAMILAACGSARDPIIDTTNVDPGKYLTDLNQCKQEKTRQSFWVGDYVEDCMKKRGYNTLPTG